VNFFCTYINCLIRTNSDIIGGQSAIFANISQLRNGGEMIGLAPTTNFSLQWIPKPPSTPKEIKTQKPIRDIDRRIVYE
jgi:hypothetical protein